MEKDEIFVLEKTHPAFDGIKEAIIKSQKSKTIEAFKANCKRQWNMIWEKLPELKDGYERWINSFPQYDIIEFIKIRDNDHAAKLQKTKNERQKETLERYGLLEKYMEEQINE